MTETVVLRIWPFVTEPPTTASSGAGYRNGELGINASTASGGPSLFQLTDESIGEWTRLVASGAAGGILTTKGDLLTHDGTTDVRQGIGEDLLSPVAKSASSATGWQWRPPTGPIKALVQGDTPYSVAADDGTLLHDNTAAFTTNLPPTATNKGRIIRLKKRSATGGGRDITVTPDGSDTIDGAASFVLNSKDEIIAVQSDGVSDWVII